MMASGNNDGNLAKRTEFVPYRQPIHAENDISSANNSHYLFSNEIHSIKIDDRPQILDITSNISNIRLEVSDL